MVLAPIATAILSEGTSLIGWASAPFDPEWERRYPRRSALMAMAGPAANFTLMFLAVIAIQVGSHFHLFRNAEWGEFLGRVLLVLFELNLLLGLFNLVPAPPLDGSSAIMFFHERCNGEKVSGSTAKRKLWADRIVGGGTDIQRVYPHIRTS